MASRLGTRRLGSVDNELVEVLVQRPILSPRTAAQTLHVTEETACNALARFERAGVVRQITDGRRNRVWAAEEVLDLLDRFELDVATDGDGKAVAPTRHLRPGSSKP